MGTSKLVLGQPDKMLGGSLLWTSIPSRGSRNTPSRFILQKPEISAGTDEPSGSRSYHCNRLYLWFLHKFCSLFFGDYMDRKANPRLYDEINDTEILSVVRLCHVISSSISWWDRPILAK